MRRERRSSTLQAAALALTMASACKSPGSEPVPVGESAPHATLPPPVWSLHGTRADTCIWQRHAFSGREGSQTLATFPARCNDADLAWSGDKAIVWLLTPRGDRVFTITLGGAPVEVPVPESAAMHAVGFDDVPLVFATPNRSISNDVRAWAWDGKAWTEREHGAGKRLEELAIWRDQRGESARKRRVPQGLVPLSKEELTTLGDVPTPEGEANQIAQALGDDRNKVGPNTFVVPPNAPTWWQLDAGGAKMAIRHERDRFLPDVRRLVNGAWQKPPTAAPTVDGMRLVIWRAGVEVRGTWILLTSDGRGGTLLDASNGLKLWGYDTALSLFAP